MVRVTRGPTIPRQSSCSGFSQPTKAASFWKGEVPVGTKRSVGASEQQQQFFPSRIEKANQQQQTQSAHSQERFCNLAHDFLSAHLWRMGNSQPTTVNNYRYPSGNVYSGTLVSGKRHGQGTLTWPDGASYSGFWQNDMCEGEGTLRFPNGSVFQGNFVRNNPHGEGKLVTVAGEVLQGTWIHLGRASGFSVPVSKFTFHGEISDSNSRTEYHGPVAIYMNSGLVSLPNMKDPSEALLPYALAMDVTEVDPKLAEEGRALFQQGMSENGLPVAVPVESAYAGKTMVYGQHEPAFVEKHPDEHSTYSLLDPRLYLSSLGIPVAPTNVNRERQDALRAARTGNGAQQTTPQAHPVTFM